MGKPNKPRVAPKFQATEENMKAIVSLLFPNGINHEPAHTMTVVEIAEALEMTPVNVRTVITGLRKVGVPIELPGGSRYAAFARSLGIEPPAPAPKPQAVPKQVENVG